jgi:hypothetical protein
MGEYEATIERLNKILTENDFPKVNEGVLYPDDIKWYTSPHITIQFDKSGRYIKPEHGEYT